MFILADLIQFLAFSLLVSVVYIALPLARRLFNCKAFDEVRAKRISMWNSCFLCAYFAPLFYGDPYTLSSPFLGFLSILAAFGFYWLNMLILTAEKQKKK